MKKIKEFLLKSMGTVGMILFFLVSLLLAVYPLLMFNLPTWLYLLLALLIQFVFINIPFFLELLWVVGFFGAISGPQDIISIIYYIVFAIIIGSTIAKIIKGCIKK